MNENENVGHSFLANVDHQQVGSVVADVPENCAENDGGQVPSDDANTGQNQNCGADHAVDEAENVDLGVDLVGGLEKVFAVFSPDIGFSHG